jgi:D-arabinose 1-dehydrogenase-like Zn-dependent alcohol dehydrogenase
MTLYLLCLITMRSFSLLTFFWLSHNPGQVKCSVELAPLADISKVFERLRAGTIKGRVVINMEA